MTSTTLDVTHAEISTKGWSRVLGPLGGLGIVAGLIGLLVSPAGEDTGDTAAAVVAYAADNEGWIVATVLYALATLALGGAFVAALAARLRGIATETESCLILIGGIVLTLGFAFCWIVWSGPLADTPSDPALALVHAESYLAIDDIGWFLFGAAGVGAAIMAVPASIAATRAGLSKWLGWLGVVAGVASLGTVAFLGMFAWMAWIAVASIILLVARRPA